MKEKREVKRKVSQWTDQVQWNKISLLADQKHQGPHKIKRYEDQNYLTWHIRNEIINKPHTNIQVKLWMLLFLSEVFVQI